jgi:predicted enzyme related to lactoylglutathione lyase
MINYRVDDLNALLAQLKSNSVEILEGPDSEENGKFAWVMDPDGTKVELWEPMIAGEKNKKA